MRFSLIALLATLLFSCSSKENNTANTLLPDPTDSLQLVDEFNYDTLVGSYVGEFAGSPMQINLTMVTPKHAVGYNVHKGLVRNMNGTVASDGEHLILKMSEPGDHEFDGVFDLTIDQQTFEMQGKWSHLKGKLSDKLFTFQKLPEETVSANGEFTRENLSSYFNFSQDSIGTYHFSQDGMVSFEYYPSIDEENHIDQLETIQGTWSLSKNTVTVSWNDNNYFKSKKMVLKVIVRDKEAEEYSLKGDGVEIYPYMY